MTPEERAEKKNTGKRKDALSKYDNGMLTLEMETFVNELFVNNFNIKQAAIKAGTHEKIAASKGARWISKPQVQAAIEKRREYLRNTQEVDAARIVQELARIAFFDLRRLLDHDGKPIPPKQLPDDIAAALSSIGVSYTEGVGEQGEYCVLRNVKYVPHDKLQALKQLANMLGFTDGNSTTYINNTVRNNIIVNWNDLYTKQALTAKEIPAETKELPQTNRAMTVEEEILAGLPTTPPAPPSSEIQTQPIQGPLDKNNPLYIVSRND